MTKSELEELAQALTNENEQLTAKVEEQTAIITALTEQLDLAVLTTPSKKSELTLAI